MAQTTLWWAVGLFTGYGVFTAAYQFLHMCNWIAAQLGEVRAIRNDEDHSHMTLRLHGERLDKISERVKEYDYRLIKLERDRPTDHRAVVEEMIHKQERGEQGDSARVPV